MNTGKVKLSYNTYYKAFKKLNISFIKQGKEGCATCRMDLHKKNCQCQDECKKNFGHKKLHRCKTSVYYQFRKTKKVVMLPMIEQFKRAIFIRRLCCFNEMFASVGKMRSKQKDVAVIWHEAIAGKKTRT